MQDVDVCTCSFCWTTEAGLHVYILIGCLFEKNPPGNCAH